jgi:hypothetical protein
VLDAALSPEDADVVSAALLHIGDYDDVNDVTALFTH